MKDARHDHRRYAASYEHALDDPVLPHVRAASEAVAARQRLLAREADAERHRLIAAEQDSEAARVRLAAQSVDPADDDGMVDHYEGDHQAVIDEVPAEGIRRDGWTAARRLLFLDRLAEHGSVKAACAAVGLTRQSVYNLRPRAPAFAAAMDRIIREGTALLADTLLDRALRGHEVPVVHKGVVVATRTVHHDQLGVYLLRVRDPLNYAPIDELERWKKHRALPAPAASDPAALAEPPAQLPSPLPQPPLDEEFRHFLEGRNSAENDSPTVSTSTNRDTLPLGPGPA